MRDKLRWGVLGVAKIAVDKVIRALRAAANGEVVAIASRDGERAKSAALALGIPTAHGSYQALLDDPDVDAVYNPLPNHLHVPMSIRALECGKHVLVEKPVALTAAEARTLLAARDRHGRKVEEAFMVRTHPQWLRVRELVGSGRIGRLRAVQAHFSYFNDDPGNVRNRVDYGGGALMDIGCYPITLSRFLFGEEPLRVAGCVERDPAFGTDRLTSGVLEFATGQAIFSCATQLMPHQRVQVLGTKGRIEVPVPFNAPPDRETRILVDDGRDLFGGGIETLTFPACDQYRIQAELFAKAVFEDTAPPLPLEDSVANMRVIDAVFRAAESGHWETP